MSSEYIHRPDCIPHRTIEDKNKSACNQIESIFNSGRSKVSFELFPGLKKIEEELKLQNEQIISLNKRMHIIEVNDLI
jgi:flagellar motor protein MotB